MKRTVASVFVCALVWIVPAAAQESDTTTITSTTTSTGADLLDGTWYMQDATPIGTGKVDLRFSFGVVSTPFPGNHGDSDDDFFLTPAIHWGCCNDVELSIGVPIWLGDGGDVGALEDGNYDTNIGVLWRIAEDWVGQYDVAISGSARIPTGDNSDKVDGELRLILSHDYDSGVRSHFNVFGATMNGTNDESADNDNRRDNGNLALSLLGLGALDGLLFDNNDQGGQRDFQYGIVIGADGPLCSNGAVRWVFDYMHRSSKHDGQNNWNMAELGWEWTVDDASKLGFSVQVNLDRSTDAPNIGAMLTFAHALTF